MNKTKIKSISYPDKYLIKWLVNYLKLPKSNISVALCSKQNRVAFLTYAGDKHKILTVKDVLTNDNGICTDSSFCLNTLCPFNKNDKESFAAAMNLPKEETDFDALVKLFEKINNELLPEHTDFTKPIMYFKTPFIEWVKD